MQPYPPGRVGDPRAARRPGTVTASVVMTYIGAGLMVLVGLGFLITAASAGAAEQTAVQQALGAAVGLAGIGVFTLVVGAVLIVLAVLTQRGRRGPRTALTVIGGIAVVLDVVQLATGKPQAVISLVWVVVAVGLLWSGQARSWFRQAG